MLSLANISLGISFEHRKARRPLNLDEKHTNTSNERLRIDYPFDHIVAPRKSMVLCIFPLNAGYIIVWIFFLSLEF